MGFDSYGAPQFGLNDVAIAAYNATNDYETAVDVPSVQALRVDMQVVSAQLEGDDQITDTASSVIGAQLTLRFGSLSIAALEVLLGIASVPSGAVYDHLQIGGGDKMPYFGVCGKMLATVGSGDCHVFLPKCKVMSDFTIVTAEYGQYTIPEVTVQAVQDATYDCINIIEDAAAQSVAIPPTYIAS